MYSLHLSLSDASESPSTLILRGGEKWNCTFDGRRSIPCRAILARQYKLAREKRPTAMAARRRGSGQRSSAHTCTTRSGSGRSRGRAYCSPPWFDLGKMPAAASVTRFATITGHLILYGPVIHVSRRATTRAQEMPSFTRGSNSPMLRRLPPAVRM